MSTYHILRNHIIHYLYSKLVAQKTLLEEPKIALYRFKYLTSVPILLDLKYNSRISQNSDQYM